VSNLLTVPYVYSDDSHETVDSMPKNQNAEF